MGRVLDPKLVQAAQTGDTAAWRALIEATQSRLYKFCLVLCGDPIRAEDLCQDVYLKLFDNIGKLTQPEAFIDWLFRLTRNLYIDGYRKNREQATLLDDNDLAAAGDLTEHLAIHQTLSHFKPEDRWLLLLVDMEGYSYLEAANHLKISEDAVRSRLFRLRQEFLEKWKKRETK